MSKIYDLYPASERKVDNWRRRILGYEKMKRDMQRQIQILRNKNKKQKEVIDKAIELINKYESIKAYYEYIDEDGYDEYNYDEDFKKELLDILKEVSK